MFRAPTFEPCAPPAWARGGHRQTILDHLLPSTSVVALDPSTSTLHEIPLPDGAIAVNGPIDLEDTSQLLHRGWNLMYDIQFSVQLRREVSAKRKRGLLDGQYRFPFNTSLRDFDEIYTGPAGGFGNRQNYYSTCSAKPGLKRIRIPTFLLTAGDDPFIDARHYRDAEKSSAVTLHIEPEGGHLGFLHHKKTPLGTTRWLDYALWDILRGL